MSLVLVTGGAGFIGSNTVIELVLRGHEVRVLDDLSTGTLENLSPVKDDIKFIEGDIRSIKDVSAAVEDVDLILHEAALRSVPRSVDNPTASNDVNVSGTLNVLVSARDAGVKRVVYASSSSVYGDNTKLPFTEELPPRPLSPYAVSKLAAEHYCSVFTKLYGLDTISLRYFNVFGPRQDKTSKYAAVFPNFITRMLSGESPTIYGDGNQSRDFTFIKNVVDANIKAIEAEKTGGAVVNIACGESHTVNEIHGKLAKEIGVGLKPEYVEPRPADPLHTRADISKASKLLDFKPKRGFDEGIAETVDWFKKNP